MQESEGPRRRSGAAEVGQRTGRGFAVCFGALLAVFSLTSCSLDQAPRGDAQTLQKAVQQLQDAGSFRMVGELRWADGTKSTFDARLDGRGNCRGTLDKAESLLAGERVWTRWDDSALRDAVWSLNGSPIDAVDPTEPKGEDTELAAMNLLRGAYMITDLPSENRRAEGIAPVCQTGELFAGVGDASGDVVSVLVEHNGGNLRRLSRVTGPVTLRVYVPAEGKPTVRRAEYLVDGGESLSARFSELGESVTVSVPATAPTVPSGQVLGLLG